MREGKAQLSYKYGGPKNFCSLWFKHGLTTGRFMNYHTQKRPNFATFSHHFAPYWGPRQGPPWPLSLLRLWEGGGQKPTNMCKISSPKLGESENFTLFYFINTLLLINPLIKSPVNKNIKIDFKLLYENHVSVFIFSMKSWKW